MFLDRREVIVSHPSIIRLSFDCTLCSCRSALLPSFLPLYNISHWSSSLTISDSPTPPDIRQAIKPRHSCTLHRYAARAARCCQMLLPNLLISSHGPAQCSVAGVSLSQVLD